MRFRKVFYFVLSLIKGTSYYARKVGVKVGHDCRLYIRRFGSEPFLIEIGNNVTITKGVTFITHDGSTCLVKDLKGRRYLYKKIIIGNNVFIGMNTLLLPGVRIGNNVVIGAGSVVSKSIPDNTIVGGSPAKFITTFDSYKEKVLTSCVSDIDIDYTLSYEDRVLKLLDNNFKKSLISK
ncbi:acyltransferase [Spirosoma oryzicola]|uniref:acyltransferase n=1 Tax=Spirosoma oryzicola TaxID=2898794 RepID=UPI001E3ABB91|nr:acyltransferase [Spirosoma oryzicola]UHG93162.1 acyltransferase [Spirosoma oryzicola]